MDTSLTKKASSSASSSPIGVILVIIGILFILAAIGMGLDWLIRGRNYKRCLKKKGKTVAVKAGAKGKNRLS